MKILAIFFLAVMVGCYGEESCIDDKAESCVVELLASIVDDTDEEEHEVCKELQTSIECLENSVESCAEEELNEGIRSGLESLKQLRTENCKMYALSPEQEEEIESCLKANEDYIFECMFEGTAASMEIFGVEDVAGNIDENLLKCRLYSFLTECFVDRIDDKCGAMAAELAKAEFSDYPDEIKEACDAVEIEVPDDDDLYEYKRIK